MILEKSGFELYSIGIVVNPKGRGDVYIDVYPVEMFPLQTGELSKISDDIVTTIEDINGKIESNNVNRSVIVKAKWLALSDSNRYTPPDVQPGESVRIFKYKDTEDYYWSTLFNEPTLRRLETVSYVFVNEPKPNRKIPITKNNTYYLTVSTEDKIIHLHTSDNDKELTTYDVIINTKDGIFTITDGRDNHIILDSNNDLLDININDTINITTPHINTTGETVDVNATTSVTVTSPSVTINAKDTIVNSDNTTVNSKVTEVNSGSTTVNSDTVDVNASAITLNGIVTVTKALTVAGPTTMAGGMAVSGGPGGAGGTISGKLDVNGDINATGTVNGSEITRNNSQVDYTPD